MKTVPPNIARDPFSLLARVANRLKTTWLRWTYPFFFMGKGVSIDISCDIPRPMSAEISIGNNVYLAPDVWLTVIPGGGSDIHPKLALGDRCSIGKRANISSYNSVSIEADVLMGPSVVIMDYNHEFSDPDRSIKEQGVTKGGRVVIERNCWIGQGAAILCGRGELIIGHNSVVGANAVVTRSCPPRSVMVGNPARIVRTYDAPSGAWVSPDKSSASVDHAS
jgi:acetyltransferase-like isoleucine patch superfamily enzyme